MCSLVEFDDEGQPELGSIVPLIDGGSEGATSPSILLLPPPHTPFSPRRCARRLQGPGARHSAPCHRLLRVLPGRVPAATPVPHVHHRLHPAQARALHRLRVHGAVAQALGCVRASGAVRRSSRLTDPLPRLPRPRSGQGLAGGHALGVRPGPGARQRVRHKRRNVLPHPRRRQDYHPSHRLHQRPHLRRLRQRGLQAGDAGGADAEQLYHVHGQPGRVHPHLPLRAQGGLRSVRPAARVLPRARQHDAAGPRRQALHR